MRPLKPILEVAEACGLTLEPRGLEYATICPNHDDRNASLFIHSTKEVWVCYGCSRGGSALALVRFLGKPDTLAIDGDAPEFVLPPTTTRTVDWVHLGERFCALSVLIDEGLVDPRLLRDLDAAAVNGDDGRVEGLLALVEEQVLTRAVLCATV
jgi:hypothetical protein